MAQSDDESNAVIERALTESQRLEREELAAALQRQRDAHERVVSALSKRDASD